MLEEAYARVDEGLLPDDFAGIVHAAGVEDENGIRPRSKVIQRLGDDVVFVPCAKYCVECHDSKVREKETLSTVLWSFVAGA